MLTSNTKLYRQNPLSKQKGVMLLITLIMLVAMTLAAIALVRSVDTTNLVSGNMAFQQASFDAADVGTEQAIRYMYSVTGLNLTCDGTGAGAACVQGYKSFHEPALEPPQAGQTWESFWTAMKNGPGVVPLAGLPSGYSGAFVVEAMCTAAGQANCSTSTTTTTVTTPQGQDMGSQSRAFNTATNTTQVIYYRITTRVDGPRNSAGYVQALVTM